jgi:hypothetical protein
MDAMTFIQQQMDNVHGQVDIVMKDLAGEQFNWPPPGTVNS